MFRRANETYREHRVAAAPRTHAKLVELVRQHAPRSAQTFIPDEIADALLASRSAGNLCGGEGKQA